MASCHSTGRDYAARACRNVTALVVALAAKNPRIAWALLAHERSYEGGYVATRPGRIIAAC